MSQDSLRIKVAGLCVEMNMENPKSFGYLEPRLKNFLSKGKPDFVVRVDENNQYSELDYITTIERKGKIFIQPEIGFIDLKNRIAEIGLPRKNKASVLTNFLRLILESLLASDCGILLHACGVVKDGQGYLFVGPPDSGKTTVAKASRGLRVLSDDCVCVRKINGSFYNFGTPWGPIVNNDSGVLKNIFFLRRGKILEFRKMAVPKLMEELFWNGRFTHLNFSLTKGILNTLSEIATSIPSYKMFFSLKDNIWEGIEGWSL